MTLKTYIRICLDEGLSVEDAWREAERRRWHATWSYVSKIAREWKLEKDHSAA